MRDFRWGAFHLARDLERLSAVHGRSAHEATALYAARILEALSSAAMERLQLEAGLAFANLVALEQTEELQRPWLNWAHALRRMGNDARHLRRELGPADSELALAFVDRWLEWFFRVFTEVAAGAEPAFQRLGKPDLHRALDTLSWPTGAVDAELEYAPVLTTLWAEGLIDAMRLTEAQTLLTRATSKFPGNARLQQLRALLLSRRGELADLEEAETILRPQVSARGGGDEEAFGILAGVLRRRWRRTRDRALLERAGRLYAAGYVASGRQNAWLGVAQSSCELLLDRPESSVEIARQVSSLIERRLERVSRRPSYWTEATLSEALLLCGRVELARERYRAALSRHDVPAGQLTSTLNQLGDLLGSLGIAGPATEWLEWKSGPSLRIGIVGHRNLPDPDRIRAELKSAFQSVFEAYPDHEVVLLTSLAEGADRLAVEVALAGTVQVKIEVILPFPVEEYRRDFGTSESVEEFQKLLRLAREVVVSRASQPSENPSREQAYVAASRTLVELSDVVVAVWNGEPSKGPGGTAESVELARQRALPLVWIHTERIGEISRENWQRSTIALG